jgi:hypothetical protein
MPTDKEIIDNLLEKLATFTSDVEIAKIASRILNKPIKPRLVRNYRDSLQIGKNKGRLHKSVANKIGLDLYDHRLDKSKS